MFKWFDLNFFFEHIPTWATVFMVALGLILAIIGPYIKKILPFQLKPILFVLSFSLMIVGSYAKGRKDSLVGTEKIIAEAKQEQVKITEKIVIKYITKVKEVKDTNAQIQNMVTTQNDVRCPIPESTVSLFNGAATNTVPDSASGTDDTTTAITYSELQKSVISNYGLYNEISERLKALQEWVREQQKLNP